MALRDVVRFVSKPELFYRLQWMFLGCAFGVGLNPTICGVTRYLTGFSLADSLFLGMFGSLFVYFLLSFVFEELYCRDFLSRRGNDSDRFSDFD